jgi:capsular exopolysaccharide synthesis family protein
VNAEPTRHPESLARQIAPRVPAGYVARGHESYVVGSEDQLNVRWLAWLLWRGRWHILAMFVVVMIPATIATLLAERLYRSTALIQVSPESVRVLPYQEIAGLTAAPANYLAFMTSQEQVLKGAGLRARVVARLQAASDARLAAEAAHLAARATIEQIPNSELFRISYLAPAPDVAARVASLYAEEYITARFQSGQETRQKARELLERELAALEKRVQSSENELVAYAQQHNMYRTDPNGGDLAQEKLAALAQQVVAADADLVSARARLSTLEGASVREFPVDLLTDGIRSRSGVLLQLQHDVAALRSSFGENWPLVRQKRDEIALVGEQLAQEKAAALQQAREQARLNVRLAEEKQTTLAAAKGEQEKLVVALQNASIRYNIIKREVETNQKLYEGLLERLKETGIASGLEFGNIHVVEPALASTTVASPNVAWNILLASVLGLTLGASVVLLREYWQNTMSTIAEVEQVSVLPVLASVPLVRAARPHALPGMRARLTRVTTLDAAEASGDPASDRVSSDPEFAESIRTVCASLLLSRSDRPPRIIAVTSARPGEGKTMIVTQLGRALAETGARTVLVECDMRRPTFSTQFEINGEGGLSLFLAGHVSQPTIHATDLKTLFVIGAGPAAPNPLALLNSERLAGLLRTLSTSFSFIVLDTPPALVMADARVVGSRADGVLLVVRAGRTSKEILRRSCAVLEASGAHLLGAVLNGSAVTESDRSYYGYS